MQSAILTHRFCLSVCPSRCGIVSKRKHHIVELFIPSGGGIILVFTSPSAVTKFQGNPVSGVLNTLGGIFFCDFRWNRRLSRYMR